jgi:hypothetical protein
MSRLVEETISNLVKNQFPEFYQTEGPIFVAFVQKYYEWLESQTASANQSYSEAKKNCKITVNAGNTSVVATSNASTFLTCFSNNQDIAIYSATDGSDYEIFTVNNVVNNTFLELTSAPGFSLANTRYSTVDNDRKNPVYYLRHFYDDVDIDKTAQEFLVYFKEKYLKGIQFDTRVDQRRLIKHALDIYRSKGSERSIDLLFKLAFGTGAKIYYPGDDVFRLSGGQWFKPKYLEVSLNQNNVKLAGKQIFGYFSGATAFVETVVRKSVRGRLIDVLYMSAVNGRFQTGELINSIDKVLNKNERPYVTGSLTEIIIEDGQDVGVGFSVGDVLDISSVSGEGGQARVSEITNLSGIVNFNFLDGGYGYTVNAEVLVAQTSVRITDLNIPPDFFNYANDYFEVFETVKQPLANITYEAATSTFLEGEEVFCYDGGGNVIGHGEILAVSGNTSTGVMLTSIFEGSLDTEPLYTTGNVKQANITTYVDVSAQGNLIGYIPDQVELNVTNLVGAFEEEEIIYQIEPFYGDLSSDFISARATIRAYVPSIGSNGTAFIQDISGVFKNTGIIYGENSGASAELVSQSMIVGFIDQVGSFVTTPNNHTIFTGTGSNGTIDVIYTGTGADFDISANLLYTESFIIEDNFIKNYAACTIGHETLSGTVLANSLSNEIVGSGTSFLSEVGYDLTGFVAVIDDQKIVTGDGTLFQTELKKGDIITISNTDVVRVLDIVSNTKIIINSYPTFTSASTPIKKTNYLIITDGTTGNCDARVVTDVLTDELLTVDAAPTFNNGTATLTRSWGFPSKPEANVTFGTIEEITTTTTNVVVGRIQSITAIARGDEYNVDPIVRIYEPLTYWNKTEDSILTLQGTSGIFSPGELVTQASSNGRALVLGGTTSSLIVQRLRVFDDNYFEVSTANTSTLLVGEESGSTANITLIEPYTSTPYIGWNANVIGSVVTGNGGIAALEVIQSGFGFRDGESVILEGEAGSIDAIADLGLSGEGNGFYRQKGGWLSDQKKLFDGLYYQDYSYEVRSSVLLNKYEDMLRQLLHVAGTKYYGALVFDTYGNSVMSIVETNITSTP